LFFEANRKFNGFSSNNWVALRLSEGKDCLTVLDFVGNSRPEYDFESKFRARENNNFSSKEIEDDFPHLPLGCSIVLEKKTKENILEKNKGKLSIKCKSTNC
jgi:hypothetical protein